MKSIFEKAIEYETKLEKRAWKVTHAFNEKAKELDEKGICRSNVIWEECAASFAKGDFTEVDWPLLFTLEKIDWKVSNNRLSSVFVFVSSYCKEKGIVSYEPDGNYAIIDKKDNCIISPPSYLQVNYFIKPEDAKEVVKYLKNISFNEEKERYVITKVISIR